MTTENSDKKDVKSSNTRWWEYYLVRYFVGTVIGTLIIIFLVYNPNSGIHELIPSLVPVDLTKLESSWIWLFGLVGLSFCYIASSPILVLHAFRSSIYQLKLSDLQDKKNLAVIASSIIVFGVIIFWVLHTLNVSWIACTIIVVFLLQLTLIVLESRLKKLNEFYLTLSQKRAAADDDKSKSEFIESYRHLREHGNAFMIVLMELLLGVILYHTHSYNLLVSSIVVWIIPACCVWFIGSYLEAKFKAT